jgi:hypothetical protein
MSIDDESFDMNVFEKLMEGKHNKFLSNTYDDSMSIEITNNLFHFGQNKLTDKSFLDHNNNYNYYEIAYPFSKRIKLKHNPEAAQENKSVQYTADVIVDTNLKWCTAKKIVSQIPGRNESEIDYNNRDEQRCVSQLAAAAQE